MEPHLVVRIHVAELNDAAASDHKDRRNRQQVMLLSRGLFQIDSVVLELLQRSFIYLVGKAEGQRGSHATIGQQRTPKLVLFAGFAHVRGPIWGNTDELEAHFVNLGLNVSQLTQLLVAVWSPASTVKNQRGRGPLD